MTEDEHPNPTEFDTEANTSAMVYGQFAKRVIALAESHLSDRLATRVDGEDVAQSVFRTFFRRQELGEFNIENSVQLWALLAKITMAKVKSQARRHTAAKRNISAETTEAETLDELRSWNPSPVDAVVFVDLLNAILEGLSDSHGHILSLRMEGWSKVEIAKELNISRRSVDRVLELLQGRLERLDN